MTGLVFNRLSAVLLGAVCVGVLGFSACRTSSEIEQPIAPETGAAHTTPIAAAEDGLTTFTNRCSACHANSDSVMSMSAIAPHTKQLESLKTFTAFLRNPGQMSPTASGMPAFDATDLSDAQVEAIYTYLLKQYRQATRLTHGFPRNR
jgi:mono/diheme cytochrome c family protein